MEFDEGNIFSTSGSTLMGGIFICNRKTMKECFERKLFALPSFKEGFVKKIKAGMILFLLEYEERKLYGVFEAACDGACNIFPQAFSSSGKYYPAQVRFTRICNCHPLTENEFCGAIKENYYTPRKFKLELSDKQVLKILRLFNSRKNRIQRLNSSVCRKAVAESEKPGLARLKSTGSQNFVSKQMGPNEKKVIKSRRYQGFSQPNSSHSMSYNEPISDRDDSLVDIRSEKYQTVYHADDMQAEDFIFARNQRDHTFVRNSPMTSFQDSIYSVPVPSFQRELPSTASDFDLSSIQEFTTIPRRGSIGLPPESHLHQSHSDSANVLSTNYLPVDVSSNHKAHKAYTDLPCPVQNPVNSHISLLDHENSKGRSDFTDLENYYGQSFFDPYVPPSSAVVPNSDDFVRLQTVISVPVNSSSNHLHSPCYSPTVQFEDSSRGLRYWNTNYASLSEVVHFDNNMALSSPQKSPLYEQHLYASECEDGYDNGRLDSFYLTYDHEYYPAGVTCNMRWDAYQRKTSVFSRLSKAPNAGREEYGAYDPDSEISLDELVAYLSKQRSRRFESSKCKAAHIGEKRPFSYAHLELAQDVGLEDDGLRCVENGVNDVVSKRQFVNFKRRTEIHKLGGRTGASTPMVNEGSKSSSKRKAAHIGEKRPYSNAHLELAQDDGLRCIENGVNDVVSKRQFVNFKRRSEIHKLGGRTGASTPMVDEGSESSSAKQKKRKLIRPTFTSGSYEKSNNDCQNEQITGQSNNGSDANAKESVECGQTSLINNKDLVCGSYDSNIEELFQKPIENIIVVPEKCIGPVVEQVRLSAAILPFQKCEFESQNPQDSSQQPFEAHNVGHAEDNMHGYATVKNTGDENSGGFSNTSTNRMETVASFRDCMHNCRKSGVSEDHTVNAEGMSCIKMLADTDIPQDAGTSLDIVKGNKQLDSLEAGCHFFQESNVKALTKVYDVKENNCRKAGDKITMAGNAGGGFSIQNEGKEQVLLDFDDHHTQSLVGKDEELSEVADVKAPVNLGQMIP